MKSVFDDRVIVILSPQPWDYLFISKHHYAQALSRYGKVIFVSAPYFNLFPSHRLSRKADNLHVLDFSVPLPAILKFKSPALYKRVLSARLGKVLQRLEKKIDFYIDFGCRQFFDSLDFLNGGFKIYFPVDDNAGLSLSNRGADLTLTVSQNILKKFEGSGSCYFINHGLAEDFAVLARKKLEVEETRQPKERIKVGYAGNLLIPFLDVSVLKQILKENPAVEFHFFGRRPEELFKQSPEPWLDFFVKCENSIFHGHLGTSELALAYCEMDAFLVCYKPDYKNYHGENSHKVLEYLSTGRVVISTYLSIYDGSNLVEMAGKDRNEELRALLKTVLSNLGMKNAPELSIMRRKHALQFTYEQNIGVVSDLVRKKHLGNDDEH